MAKHAQKPSKNTHPRAAEALAAFEAVSPAYYEAAEVWKLAEAAEKIWKRLQGDAAKKKQDYEAALAKAHELSEITGLQVGDVLPMDSQAA